MQHQRQKPLSLLISGYYGLGNAGDEAVLLALIRGLRARYSPVRLALTVLSGNPAQTEARLAPWQVRAIPRMGSAALRALARADCFLSGGGSLLQDVTSSRSLFYYLGLIGLARLLGKPVFIFAQGIGPLHHRGSRFWTRFLLNRVTAITVRDPASAAELAGLGVTRPPLTVTADPVFTLDPRSAAENGEAQAILSYLNKDSRPLIALALRSWPGRYWQVALLELLQRCLAETEARLVFLPFHYPMDLEIARNLAARLAKGRRLQDKGLELYGDGRIMLQSEPLSPQTLLGLLAACDLVIGMRLHALIMATLAGTPILGVSYDPKVAVFLKELGETPWLDTDLSSPLSPLAAEALWQRLKEKLPEAGGRSAHRNLKQQGVSRDTALAGLKARANQTFTLLYQFLDELVQKG